MAPPESGETKDSSMYAGSEPSEVLDSIGQTDLSHPEMFEF
jgi:hypothetical protein